MPDLTITRVFDAAGVDDAVRDAEMGQLGLDRRERIERTAARGGRVGE